MRVWVKLKTNGKPEVYLRMRDSPFYICPDGSVSNWLEINYGMKGWQIIAVGIMSDHIEVEVA